MLRSLAALFLLASTAFAGPEVCNTFPRVDPSDPIAKAGDSVEVFVSRTAGAGAVGTYNLEKSDATIGPFVSAGISFTATGTSNVSVDKNFLRIVQSVAPDVGTTVVVCLRDLGSAGATDTIAIWDDTLLTGGTSFKYHLATDLFTIHSIEYTFPTSQGGAGSVLSNDGTGALYWGAGSSLAAAGANGAVQFNSGGMFGADATKFFWDNSTKRLGIGNDTPAFPLDVTGNANVSSALTSGTLSVGSAKFTVDANGNVTKINNVTYSWPSSQGAASTYLQNDSAGNLSWVTAATANLVSGTGTATRVAFWSTSTALSSSAGLYWDDSSKFLGVGAFTSSTPTTHLHVASTSTAADISKGITMQQSEGTANAAILNLKKSHGSVASPTIVANSDFLGIIDFAAHDGSVYQITARIAAQVDGTVALGSVPTDMIFYTGASAGGNEAMRIRSDGNVGVLDTNPGSLFSVSSGRFAVNSTGNVTKINNVTYSWPASQGGASTVLTNNGSGTLTWGTAATGTVTGSGTATRVAFWSTSTALSSNANLFWDDTNSRLGIGNAAPTMTLEVTGSGLFKQASSATAVTINGGTASGALVVTGFSSDGFSLGVSGAASPNNGNAQLIVGSNSIPRDFEIYTGNTLLRFVVDRNGEVTIKSISSDGTGKVACVKSDGTLGTCSSAVGAGGTCTCG